MAEYLHKYNREDLDAEYQQKSASVQASHRERNFEAFASRILFERVTDNPTRHLEFGVYWYPVKQVLRENGYNLGDATDKAMVEQYKIDGEHGNALTLIAAERMAASNRANYFVGNDEFDLLDDGETVYNLYDLDMRLLADFTTK